MSAAAPRAPVLEALRETVTAARLEADAPSPEATLLVALSGGVDSCVLLHVLRFGAWQQGRLAAAHFDHGMRPDSDADARWVRGLCAAWGVPLVLGRAVPVPGTEDEARRARYAFLERARRETAASHVATAHHADDQAETVLFRLLRGTGPAGLVGIRAVRDGRVWRPLLRARRAEVKAYARAAGLGWREDPTNARLDRARNAIRHRILPDAERLVSASAVMSLAHLAEAAAEDEAAWRSLMPGLLASLGVKRSGGGASVDRDRLATLHPGVLARVIRVLAHEAGAAPGREATRAAVSFVMDAPSGRALDIGGGVTLRRELDRIVCGAVAAARAHDPSCHRSLEIADPGPGSGQAVLAGRPTRVEWGPEVPATCQAVTRFDASRLRFPLTVRGWAPGDRIRLAAGSRKLKQVFLEARIPRTRRHSVPILADAAGEVLWAAGVARSAAAPVDARPPAIGARPLAIGVETLAGAPGAWDGSDRDRDPGLDPEEAGGP